MSKESFLKTKDTKTTQQNSCQPKADKYPTAHYFYTVFTAVYEFFVCFVVVVWFVCLFVCLFVLFSF